MLIGGIPFMNYKDVKVFLSARQSLLAKEEYATIVKLIQKMEDKENPEVRQKSDALKQKGNEKFTAGKYEESIVLYTEALAVDSTSVAAYSNRSLAYSKVGKSSEAIADCLSGLKIDPDFVKFYIRLGMLHMPIDQAKAHEYFKQGLEREPENAHFKELVESSAPKNGGATSKMHELLGNQALQDTVKNFIKDKSPSELANMMKSAMESFK